MVIMAGMLPGVECARRRRLRQGGSMESPSGSRRSSFCLYTTGYETHLGRGSTFMVTTPTHLELHDMYLPFLFFFLKNKVSDESSFCTSS